MKHKTQLLIIYKPQDEELFKHIESLINSNDDISVSQITGVEDDSVIVMKCLTNKWNELKKTNPADKYLFIDCNPENYTATKSYDKFGMEYGSFDTNNYYIKISPAFAWTREIYNIFLRELQTLVDKRVAFKDALIGKEIRTGKSAIAALTLLNPIGGAVIYGIDKHRDKVDAALLRQQPLLLFGECKYSFDGKSTYVDSEYCDNCNIKEADTLGSSWYWRLVEAGRINDEVNAYFFDENVFVGIDGIKETYNKNGNLSYFNCSLVKYGHYDILIDCGSIDLDSKVMVDKLKDFVVDGIIECVVVSHYQLENYYQMVGNSLTDDYCIFDCFIINLVVDNDSEMTNNSANSGTAYSMYMNKSLNANERYSIEKEGSYDISLCDNLEIQVVRGCNKVSLDEDNYSLVTIVSFNDDRMLFVGDLTDYSWITDKYADLLENIVLMRFSGSYTEYTKMEGLNEFLKLASPEVVVFGSPLNHWNNGKYFIKGDSITGLINYIVNCTRNTSIKLYSCGYVNADNIAKSVSGDIDFTLYKNEFTLADKTKKWCVSCSFNGGSGEKSIIDNSYFAFAPDDIRLYPLE